jgi:hypothetical protein
MITYVWTVCTVSSRKMLKKFLKRYVCSLIQLNIFTKYLLKVNCYCQAFIICLVNTTGVKKRGQINASRAFMCCMKWTATIDWNSEKYALNHSIRLLWGKSSYFFFKINLLLVLSNDETIFGFVRFEQNWFRLQSLQIVYSRNETLFFYT